MEVADTHIVASIDIFDDITVKGTIQAIGNKTELSNVGDHMLCHVDSPHYFEQNGHKLLAIEESSVILIE